LVNQLILAEKGQAESLAPCLPKVQHTTIPAPTVAGAYKTDESKTESNVAKTYCAFAVMD